MFLLTKYQYYIYIFSPFPPLHFGAAFSILAFSTPAFSTVPRFPFSPFQSSLGGCSSNYCRDDGTLQWTAVSVTLNKYMPDAVAVAASEVPPS